MTKGKYIRTKATIENLRKSHLGKKLSVETRKKISEKNTGRRMKESTKKKISIIHKGKHFNPQTEFKKGQKAWNFEGKGRLKRKMKKLNGKLVLNSHYVFCTYYRLDCIPKGFIIHHKDNNSLNDSIDNLIMMTDKAHKEYHNKIAKNKFITGEKLI